MTDRNERLYRTLAQEQNDWSGYMNCGFRMSSSTRTLKYPARTSDCAGTQATSYVFEGWYCSTCYEIVFVPAGTTTAAVSCTGRASKPDEEKPPHPTPWVRERSTPYRPALHAVKIIKRPEFHARSNPKCR